MVLQRTFSSFPAGWPGVALFTLRFAVGATAIVEALLAAAAGHFWPTLAIRCVAALAGLALIVGFATPIASAVIATIGAVLLACLRSSELHLVDSHMALFEMVLIGSAVTVLGPGASSFDALLFGRREIKIEKRRPGNDTRD